GPAVPWPVHGVRWGLMVCEDMWFPRVTRALRAKGAELLVVPNGSPFDLNKEGVRLGLARDRVAESGLPLVYVNPVGGQDELVFDGGSFVLNPDGSMPVLLERWREQLVLTEWERSPRGWRCRPGPVARQQNPTATVYQALVLGLRDYVDKNGFPGVVIGLSGGIDSALTAAVAVDALGPARVRGVLMPSPFTSAASLRDAAACAERLGLHLDRIPIRPAMEACEAGLRPVFRGAPRDVTEENLQARIRGQLLMAISNKFGPMVLTTGNKSEMAVGYATLYGDMCGGYSVLKDVYKTTVYELAAWRNRHRPPRARGPRGEVIPRAVLDKAPTAELRADQRDEDSLPPYPVLDAILEGLVEREDGVDALIAAGHDPQVVLRVQNLLYNAEYKRR
ncbi:MAG: NAD+ synthase, partial [Gammaproteobacteria bacterium]|nr:NAD+ synthase [Gammaproteobacteria bacterium]NIP80296.1 NAD+ synthase [Gemmatimonadota bacterium]NIX45212.1 NAD+ synthase [Gemmatimonadota bacterium]